MTAISYGATHSQAASAAGDLDALANAGIVLDTTVVDNTANLDPWGAIQGAITFNAAPAISDANTIDVYAIISYDGTNYETVDASNLPNVGMFLCSIPVKSVSTSAQNLTSTPFPMPGPYKFKCAYKNNTGTALKTTTAGSFTLYSWQAKSV